MRAVFMGAGAIARMAAQFLLERGHEVVIVEQDKTVIDELSQSMDCGFLHGDGSKPAILEEADPESTDVLYCLTGNDQANILASLVGRSLGFERVVTKIEYEELEHICLELGLEDTIVPARTIGRYLSDLFEGQDPTELTTMIRHDARVVSFVVRDNQVGPLADLELPESTRIVCLYRKNRFLLPDDRTRLQESDEVVLITHRDQLPEITERWVNPPPAE